MRAPPSAGNRERWPPGPRARTAASSPTEGASPSSSSFPPQREGRVGEETSPGGVAHAAGPSSLPPAPAPGRARPHGPHPAPTPRSGPRRGSTAPASPHRGGWSSRDRQTSPAPAPARPRRSGLQAWPAASTARSREAPPRSTPAVDSPGPASSPAAAPTPLGRGCSPVNAPHPSAPPPPPPSSPSPHPVRVHIQPDVSDILPHRPAPFACSSALRSADRERNLRTRDGSRSSPPYY